MRYSGTVTFLISKHHKSPAISIFIISEEVDRRFLASGHTQSIGRCLVMSKSNNVQVLRMSKLYQCDGYPDK